jgi:RNA polymerase sigma-B factor
MGDAHLTPQRRHARLVVRARGGDERARDRLVRELLPLAERVARRFASPHHPAEDLTQVAGIGLLKAIDRYDTAREAAFTTYAQAVMTGEVQRHMRDTRLVRIPRPIYEQVPRFQRALDRLTAELGRTPRRRELADTLDLSVEELIEVADAALTSRPMSLDGESGAEASWDVGEHDSEFERVEAGAALAPMLRSLSQRERMVLDLRFEDGLSQSEIADGLGLSQTQVSRILRRALEKLSELAAVELAPVASR